MLFYFFLLRINIYICILDCKYKNLLERLGLIGKMFFFGSGFLLFINFDL